MIKSNISNLAPNSHKKILVYCDANISTKCKNKMLKMVKTITRDRKKSNNKDLCLYCSRELKFSGRNNPNAKYKLLDDKLFEIIDDEFKAYLLGFIASDGHISKNNSIRISIHEKDKFDLEIIKNKICSDLKIKKVKNNMIELCINSKKICNDVIKHLKLDFSKNNKKDYQTQIPDLPENLIWVFIRGYFDGDGSVLVPSLVNRYPKCDITSSSIFFNEQLKKYCKIPCSVSNGKIIFSGNNALDFMGKIYDNANFYLKRKKDLYVDWSQWVPSLSGANTHGKELNFVWNKSRPDAIRPKKERSSDSGYDLVLLEKIKSYGIVDLYDTGIKITPEFGWYFDLVPRSSIIKSGHILANSIGIIDRTYTGNIMVPLIKIDPNAQDIKPGTRLVQLIPRPIVNINFVEVTDLDSSERNQNGFGSTGV